MAFPTNANQVQAFAGAMYGIQIGSATLAQVNNDILAAGSLTSALNGYYSASFGSVATATVAATFAANLGLTGAALEEGTNYVAARLNAAAPNARGAVIADILNLFAGLASDATFGAAATAWNTKVAAAAVYTGSTDVAIGTVVITNNVFTLTAGADTTLTGGAGVDTYIAQINADLGTGTTINAGDSLDAKGGVDALNITVAGASTAAVTSTAVTLNNVEQVLVSNFDSNTNDAHDTDFNAALWTGVTTVGLTSSSATGDTSFTSLKNVVAAQMENGAGDLTVTYLSSVTAGTADTQALSVSGLTAGTFVADSGIETIAITTGAANSTLTDLTAAGAKNLTIGGAKGLTISTALNTAITTVDASTNSGGVSLIFGTANSTVTGGSGNDTVRIDGSTVNTSDSFSAGDGTDTLQLTAATNITTATNGAKIAGFEVVRGFRSETFAEDSAASTVVAQDVSLLGSTITEVGVSSFSVGQTSGAGGTDDETIAYGANFTNLAANTKMSLSGFSVTDASAGTADDGLIINFTATADLKTDNLTGDAIEVTLGSATAGMATLGTLSGGTQDLSTAFNLTLSVDDYETVTVTSQGGANTVASITSGDMTNLVIQGSKALTVSALTAANLANINASASTANVSVVATGKASTITGGAGNDTFTGSSAIDSMSGGAGNDTLDGSGGNDVIYGGANNDSLTGGAGNDRIFGEDGDDTFADSAVSTADYEDGGAGNDTFTVAAVSNLTSSDTIIGGDGTDTIVFADATSVNLTSDITALTNVSGVEVIAVSGMNGSDTLTVNDGVVSAAGGSLALKFVTGVAGANTVDASGVLATVSSVTFTDLAGLGSTYVIGNGKDSASMGDGTDAVTVGNNAYLSANDTLAGGSGSDTISFTSTTNTTFTAAQLSNISGFETFAISTGGTGNYSLTLTDANVSAQVSAGATFTVSRGASTADTGTTKVDGSAVTASYNLSLLGETGTGTAADTLIGGAGNDTLNGGLGIDSLTGGAGNDTFAISASAQGGDAVIDFDFGTSTTYVDRYDFSGFVVATSAFDADFDTVTATAGLAANATIADDTDVFVINDQAFSNLAAMESALEGYSWANIGGGTSATTEQGDLIVLWQDTLGNTHVAIAVGDTQVGDDGDDFAVADLATMTGVGITGIATKIDVSDFILG